MISHVVRKVWVSYWGRWNIGDNMRVMIDNKIGFKKLDENNLVVFESVIRTKKECGTEYEDDKILGYYGTLRECLNGCIKHSLKSENYKELQDIVKKIDELKIVISDLKPELV